MINVGQHVVTKSVGIITVADRVKPIPTFTKVYSNFPRIFYKWICGLIAKKREERGRRGFVNRYSESSKDTAGGNERSHGEQRCPCQHFASSTGGRDARRLDVSKQPESAKSKDVDA